MDIANQFQIQYKAVCISHSAKTFGKGMNLTIPPLPAMEKPGVFNIGIVA